MQFYAHLRFAIPRIPSNRDSAPHTVRGRHHNLHDVSWRARIILCTGGLRVRGQRTETTGRKGRTVGVSKKKG